MNPSENVQNATDARDQVKTIRQRLIGIKNDMEKNVSCLSEMQTVYEHIDMAIDTLTKIQKDPLKNFLASMTENQLYNAHKYYVNQLYAEDARHYAKIYLSKEKAARLTPEDYETIITGFEIERNNETADETTWKNVIRKYTETSTTDEK